MTDHTHDPELSSWVPSTQTGQSDFPIQNLPFGVFRRRGDRGPARIGVAIGSDILDLWAARAEGLLDSSLGEAREACGGAALNALMALGRPAARQLREQLSLLLRAGDRTAPLSAAVRARVLVAAADVDMLLPAVVGDYTDFYASVHHATNVGVMFRPDSPLMANYKWVPIGYHGRASSLVPSGTPIARPSGQQKAAEQMAPTFGPSRMLDYELELGAFIGRGNQLGTPIPIAEAGEHLFGLCLVNDWSARDIQAWEYQPLGPFLGKNFATTVSPWVVTSEALEPFRVARGERPAGDPAPLDYLDSLVDRDLGGFDIQLQAWLTTTETRRNGAPAVQLAASRATDLYWTFGQMIAHHASNGCNLRPGDLLASGTISGPSRDALGSLLELTRRGREPLSLPGGETRGFLHDGDEVLLTAFCARDGAARIGFGDCRGRVTL